VFTLHNEQTNAQLIDNLLYRAINKEQNNILSIKCAFVCSLYIYTVIVSLYEPSLNMELSVFYG